MNEERTTTRAALSVRGLVAGYGQRPVIAGLDLEIPEGSFTVIVGPNGCGKSTLLRCMGGLLPPTAGEVLVDEVPIRGTGRRSLARRLAFLPQGPIAPEGVTVAGLVGRGRFPHRSWLGSWSAADRSAVEDAMVYTGVDGFADRAVDEISGGQRQRVWLAMVLAQQADTMLLDEPTTYLDLAHQLEVMRMCRSLNAEGHTLVAVLHDLNQAFRYATHLVAMKDGAVVAAGPPERIVSVDLVREVFGIDGVVIDDPLTSSPMVVPEP